MCDSVTLQAFDVQRRRSNLRDIIFFGITLCGGWLLSDMMALALLSSWGYPSFGYEIYSFLALDNFDDVY